MRGREVETDHFVVRSISNRLGRLVEFSTFDEAAKAVQRQVDFAGLSSEDYRYLQREDGMKEEKRKLSLAAVLALVFIAFAVGSFLFLAAIDRAIDGERRTSSASSNAT